MIYLKNKNKSDIGNVFFRKFCVKIIDSLEKKVAWTWKESLQLFSEIKYLHYSFYFLDLYLSHCF